MWPRRRFEAKAAIGRIDAGGVSRRFIRLHNRSPNCIDGHPTGNEASHH
jgi:hypothetical protein